VFSADIWNGRTSRWNASEPFKRIKIDNAKLVTENDVYKYFNLSQEEIDYIESQINIS